MAINLGNIFFGITPNTAGLTQASRQVQGFSQIAQNAGTTTTATAQALQRLADVSLLLHGPLSGIATRLRLLSTLASKVNIETAALVTGITLGAYAFEKIASSAIDAARSFSKFEGAQAAIAGTSEFVGEKIEYLRNVADRAGKGFDTISGAYVRLEAASKGTNLEGERTDKIFESIVQSGAKLGLTTDEVGGALRAVEQIMSKGTVQSEELRGQLGDRLPAAFTTMADAIGVSTQELGKLLKQGKITADALVPFADKLVEVYGVNLSDNINTVTAAEGRLGTSLLFAARSIDQTLGISEAYVNTLNTLAAVVNFAADNLGLLLKVIGLVGGAFIAANIVGITTAFIGLARTIGLATTALLGLNAAAMGNPWLAIPTILLKVALAVGGAIIGFEAMNALVGESEGAMNKNAAAINKTAAALKTAEQASSAFRGTLEAQIEAQSLATEVALNEAVAQVSAAQAKLSDAIDTELSAGPDSGKSTWWDDVVKSWIGDPVRNASADVDSAEKKLLELTNQMAQMDAQMDEIDAIRKKMGDRTTEPLKIFGDSKESESSIRAKTKAIREAMQSITDVMRDYSELTAPSGSRAFLKMQDDVAQKIQNYHDKLVDAKLPLETINDLTAKYSATLSTLAETQYQLEYLPNFFTALGDVLANDLDPAMDKLIDTWMEGGNILKSLADIGKMVVTDLIKSFATLAVINPLKNLLGLGGQQFPTFNPLSFLGLGGGGGGGGGAAGGYTPGFGSYGSFASGGSFQIGGSKTTSGMDDQLVSFWGKRGEKVSIGKSGHGGSGGGGTVYKEGDTIIDARGAQVGVADQIVAALQAYDKSSMVRQQKNNFKGKSYRKPTFAGNR